MDKLQDLSQSELEELLDNAERVESMALESDEIQNIQLEREMALASNRSLAEQNLDVKPRLEEQRARLGERYSQLEAVRDTYTQHCSLRDGMLGQVSPEGLFSRLQTEGASTEAESETVADDFLDGSLPLDSFLDRFLSLRSLAHKRRVRIEKLQEVLRQRTAGAADAAVTSSQASANQDPLSAAGTPSPWNQHTHHQPAQSSQPANHNSFQNATANSGGGGPGPALPYTPYPVAPPNPAHSASSGAPGQGPANPPAQFPPYPSPGSPFAPAAGYVSRPAFQPSSCPYPTQPSFPLPSGPPGPPGSAFGQYAPPSAAPYPSAYPYGGGYSYPLGPALPTSQSPTGRPGYRPGYGVPQHYS